MQKTYKENSNLQKDISQWWIKQKKYINHIIHITINQNPP